MVQKDSEVQKEQLSQFLDKDAIQKYAKERVEMKLETQEEQVSTQDSCAAFGLEFIST